MAGLDARIISDAPDTGYKIQLPSEIRNQTIAADLTRKKLEQARDEAHQAAARRQAAQMSDGDPELYVKNLERAGLFEDAQKFASTIEENRKKTLDALKTETETQETQIERSLTNVALVRDEPTYQAWRAQTVKMAPQYQQLLPPNYAEGLVPQLLEVGTKSREILKAQREAIEAGLKGDHIASLGGYLASLQTPQERAQALESAKTVLHYPEATVARFRGVDPNDPQYAEKVKALTLTPKDQADLANQGRGAYQSKEVLVNGKRATVNFDPRTGQYLDQGGKPVAVAPIPPQAAAGEVSDPLPQLSIDPNSQNILSQTGLTINAFRLLTGQGSQLPRDQATRNRAANEAQTWARAHNVDISTLPSQYKTYNDVLSGNISRLNNTKIMESELQGTIDNLKSVAKDADLGRLNVANVAKVWAGQQVNDSLAQQYALHLSQLRNELSAYYAATQGRTGNNITLQDQRDAELVLKNGLADGSLNGLQKAIENSTAKMGTVLQGSVERAQKQVWNLFGVGGNYKGGSGGGGGTEKAVTQAELRAIAARKGTTLEQETARATAAGYVVR